MTKINFREITIEDKDWIKARLAEDNDNSCERSFTTIFLYRRLYKAQMADILGLYFIILVRTKYWWKLTYETIKCMRITIKKTFNSELTRLGATT